MPSAQNKFQRIQALRKKRERAEDMLNKARKKAIWNERVPLIAVLKYILFNDMLKYAIIFAVTLMLFGGFAGGFFPEYFGDAPPVLSGLLGMIIGAVVGFGIATLGRLTLLVSIFCGGAVLFIFAAPLIINFVKSIVEKKQRKRIKSLEEMIDKIDARIRTISAER